MLTEEKAETARNRYLINLAEELMTAPIGTIEFMYNETKRRCQTQPEVAIYPRTVELLEQLAEKRSMTITEIDGKFWFS